MSTLFVHTRVCSTCYAKGLIPEVWNPYSFLSSDTSKQVFPACTSSELTTVHFSSWNCTPVLFPRIQFCFPNHSAQQLELYHQLEHFKFKFNFNLQSANQSNNVNFNHLSERTLCGMHPTLGANLCCGTLMSVHWAL